MADEPVTEVNVDVPEVKPGLKTTEFYVSIATAALGVCTLLGLFTPEESSTMMTAVSSCIGGGMTVIATVGYAWSRAKAKEGAKFDIPTLIAALAGAVTPKK